MLSGVKFVYIGHGDSSPNYQLYYDIDRKLFVIVDKRNGCFRKDGTGTCLAFNLGQAKAFRENVLVKMIDINDRLAKEHDSIGKYALDEFQKAGITTVVKPIDTDPTYAIPVKQIGVDKQEQYHILRRNYLIKANLVAMITETGSHEKHIKVVYVVSLPGLKARFKAELRPAVIDPEFMYSHMTMDAVHDAQSDQKIALKTHAKVENQAQKYLQKIVDKGVISDTDAKKIASSEAVKTGDKKDILKEVETAQKKESIRTKIENFFT
jgi:polyhydroxyalkanoate synthesis regulator phasin